MQSLNFTTLKDTEELKYTSADSQYNMRNALYLIFLKIFVDSQMYGDSLFNISYYIEAIPGNN